MSDGLWRSLEKEIGGRNMFALVIELEWEGFSPKQGKWRSSERPGGTGRAHKGSREGLKAKARVQSQNAALERCLALVEKALEEGLKVVLAIPEDSLAWRFQRTVEFERQASTKVQAVKWVQGHMKMWLLTNEKGLQDIGSRRSMRGDEERERRIQEALAGWEIKAPPGLEKEVTPKMEKRKGPPLKAAWGDPSRYKIWLRGKWKHKEHCNVLEGRAGLAAVKHLTRDAETWGKRCLLLTDSQACMGAYGKGRSSARSYVSLCRRLAAMELATGCATYWRYIETWRNASDGPSRGQKWPGVYGAAPPSGWS